MKTKLEMAHEYLLRFSGTTVEQAWQYADAMQAEADKREKEEAAQKRKEIREILNSPNTFVEREDQHFDDIDEWQPDWSQAPDWAVSWTCDKDSALWWSEAPEIHGNIWFIDGGVWQCADALSFGYTGDWRNSLRKRPK